MFKIAFTVILALLLTFFLAGCSAQTHTSASEDTTGNYNVTIIVTRDFGNELILEQEIAIELGTNAMDALQIAATVETKCGGGFVSSINGISSEYGGANSEQRDWFLYINGISSNVGANDYTLQDGDIEHWDFRDWSYQQFIPAIVGDYPQPFVSGFKDNIAPTVVVYDSPFFEEAASLAERLEEAGVTHVSAISASQLSPESKAQSNLIIIASLQNDLIAELNSLHKRLGFYAYIQDGKIISLDAMGDPYGEYSAGCGLIQATQNPWNPNGTGACENVVWMITGSDASGVKSAAMTLVNGYSELLYTYAVVVNDNTIIKIP